MMCVIKYSYLQAKLCRPNGRNVATRATANNHNVVLLCKTCIEHIFTTNVHRRNFGTNRMQRWTLRNTSQTSGKKP